MESKNLGKVLILEDNKATRRHLVADFSKVGFEVIATPNLVRAGKLLDKRNEYSAIVMDSGEVSIGDDPYALNRKARRTNPDAPLIGVTACAHTTYVCEGHAHFDMLLRVIPGQSYSLAEDVEYNIKRIDFDT
tara:strand:+ start:102 stop:500 length:399 start_codon:yes stop_codon:yes gene_type:complete